MAGVNHPKSWNDWYRFARSELGVGHDECVEYANLRFVEQQNRAAHPQASAHTVAGTASRKGWNAWYRFARDELACGHEEGVEYANLRVVEEQNRADSAAAAPLAPRLERSPVGPERAH